MWQNLPCCVKRANLYILGKGTRKRHCLPYSQNRCLTFKPGGNGRNIVGQQCWELLRPRLHVA